MEFYYDDAVERASSADVAVSPVATGCPPWSGALSRGAGTALEAARGTWKHLGRRATWAFSAGALVSCTAVGNLPARPEPGQFACGRHLDWVDLAALIDRVGDGP